MLVSYDDNSSVDWFDGPLSVMELKVRFKLYYICDLDPKLDFSLYLNYERNSYKRIFFLNPSVVLRLCLDENDTPMSL